MHSQNNVNDTIQKFSSLGRFFEYFCCHKNNEMIQITDYYYKKKLFIQKCFHFNDNSKKTDEKFFASSLYLSTWISHANEIKQLGKLFYKF
jgi:hypothetical protein